MHVVDIGMCHALQTREMFPTTARENSSENPMKVGLLWD